MERSKGYMDAKVARAKAIPPKPLEEHPCKECDKRNSCRVICPLLYRWNIEQEDR